MLGAIIGDIVGSYYEVLEIQYQKEYHTHRPYEERIKILNKDTPLFTDNCSYTDDTVLTLAIYDAIKNGNLKYEEYLRKYGLKEIDLGLDMYGRSRFGGGFVKWLKGEKEGNSYGNGCAMRISPVGYLFETLDKVKEEAIKATIPSHNHEDSINAATCVAECIYLLRKGKSKEEVKKYVESNYYHLNYDLLNLQQNYTFTSKSIDSVPQSLYVFFISSTFEDALRNALSIGGDADTIACIVGSLAEAYYGIPDYYVKMVSGYLNDEFKKLLKLEYKI